MSPAVSSYIKPHFQCSVAAPTVLQASDYTCGLAAIQKAALRLGRDASFATPEKQFELHRLAHCAHMGEGNPGCTPHGLMAAAITCGFQVTVHSGDITHIDQEMESLVLRPSHHAAFLERERTHKGLVLRGGGAYVRDEFNIALFHSILDADQVPIVLMRDPDNGEHWAVVDKIDDGKIVIDDPYSNYRDYYKHKTGQDMPRLDMDELLPRCQFGSRVPTHAVLAIGNRLH